MKTKLASLALIAGLALAGAATADPLANFYGATLNITQPNGVVVKVWFNADNTYDVGLPDGSTGKGVWAIEGDQLCTTRTEPEPMPKQCNPATGADVGDSWEMPGPNGSVIKYSLTAGR